MAIEKGMTRAEEVDSGRKIFPKPIFDRCNWSYPKDVTPSAEEE